MKRSLGTIVFVLIALTNLFAQTEENLLTQTVETPVCYAYLPNQKLTLKYKFSYGEEKFYTNLRFIKGSDNAFLPGDKIIFKTKDNENEIICNLDEKQMAETKSSYIPFEISAEDLANLQKGISGIRFVRDGNSFNLEPINDKFADTKKYANKINIYAKKFEYQKNFIEKYKEIKVIVPKFYNRLYFGYSPTIYSNNSGHDFLNIGYSGGILLKESKNIIPYLQFGAQFDWEIASKADKSKLAVSIPIDITWRCYLGQSKVALSPFVGAIFKINPRYSTSDGMLLQPGFEIGTNLDYKRFYCGVLYHMEFFTKEGMGNTRGLAVRLGINF